MKLSIIIPFYNVEKYIAECLDSVFAQDIPETEYEVICVNDCSPDGSRDTVLDYQKKHKNLVLVEHETNQGLASARNSGLIYANGEYVWFIDSDDYINTNTLKKILDIVISNKLEILNFNYNYISENKSIKREFNFYHDTGIIKGEEFLTSIHTIYWQNGSVWRKIFSRNFLNLNELKFPNYSFMEDQVFSLKSVNNSKRFMHTSECFYNYRLNTESLLNTSINTFKRVSYLKMITEMYKYLTKIKNNELKKSIEIHLSHTLNSLSKQLIYINKIDAEIIFNEINTMKKIVDFKFVFKGWRYLLFNYPNLSRLVIPIISPTTRLLRDLSINKRFKLT